MWAVSSAIVDEVVIAITYIEIEHSLDHIVQGAGILGWNRRESTRLDHLNQFSLCRGSREWGSGKSARLHEVVSDCQIHVKVHISCRTHPKLQISDFVS